MNDDLKEMLEEMKKDKEGKAKKFWSPPSDKEGSFPIRILPPIKDFGEKKFYFLHKVHWINKKSYSCANQTIYNKDGTVLHEAEDCPICKFVQKLYNTSVRDSEEWKLASSLRSQDRYTYRVIVRKKDDETVPEFYESGKTVFEMLYHIIAETDYGNITSIKDGRDFILSKKGVGRLSKYETSTPSANAGPAFTTSEKLKSLLENMKKLDYYSLIEFSTASELKNALSAFINESSSDDSEEEVVAVKDKPKEKLAEKVSKNDDVEDNIDDILKEFED